MDVALQCQHTSINNLMKSSVVKTLLPFLPTDVRKTPTATVHPHAVSSLHVVCVPQVITLSSSSACRAATCSASRLLSCQSIISPFSFCCSCSMMPFSYFYTLLFRFPLIEVDINPAHKPYKPGQ